MVKKLCLNKIKYYNFSYSHVMPFNFLMEVKYYVINFNYYFIRQA